MKHPLIVLILFASLTVGAQPYQIGIGSTANDGTGDKPRIVGAKINSNNTHFANLIVATSNYFNSAKIDYSTSLAELSALNAANGSMIVRSNDAWKVLAPGTEGYWLKIVGGHPIWSVLEGTGGSAWDDISTNALTDKLEASVYNAAWGAIDTNALTGKASTTSLNAKQDSSTWLSNISGTGANTNNYVAGSNITLTTNGGTVTIASTASGNVTLTDVTNVTTGEISKAFTNNNDLAVNVIEIGNAIPLMLAGFNADGELVPFKPNTGLSVTENTNLNVTVSGGGGLIATANQNQFTTNGNHLAIKDGALTTNLNVNTKLTVSGSGSGYASFSDSDGDKHARVQAPATVNTNVNFILPPEARDGVLVVTRVNETNAVTRITNDLTGIITMPSKQDATINTNLGYASTITLSMHENTIGSMTNAMTGDVSVTVTHVVPGKSLSFEFLADSSDRTVNFFWPAGTVVATYTTNGAPQITNLLVTASTKGKVVFESPWTNRVSKVTGRGQWLSTY